jgi:hypothetical protein
VPLTPGRQAAREQIEGFHALCREAGRDALPVSIFGAPPKAEALAGYRDAGVARAVFFLPPAARDQVLPLLDQYAALAKEIA